MCNKISDRAKYVAAPEFDKFAGTILDEKLNQADFGYLCFIDLFELK